MNNNGKDQIVTKPRVLMVVSYFHPYLGGAEQQALMISEHLIKRGFSVSVLTRSFKGLPSFEMVRGVPVYRSIRTLPRGKWFGITYILSVLWFFFRKRHTFDIIHCHILGFHSAASLLFKWVFKKRTISLVAATGPISDFMLLKNILFGRLLLKIITCSDRLIILCTQSREEALKEGFSISQIVQIPNGVDTDYFKPSLNNKRTDNKITFIGRLDHWKGVHILIPAFKKLRDMGIDAHLDIIGDGPDRDKLEIMAKDSGLQKAITFHGAVHGVATYLQESAIFVLPSLSEGLPNVMLEAMACALPVITTKVGGIVDIIKHGKNGMLVDAGNPDQLCNAMKHLLTDKKLATTLGREARRTIEEGFSIDCVVDQYVTLYENLL
ncbi:MAG: glycosyltransferase family 4 protein, partial [Proteobacteria bacterium]|nr:glycosyltransferase family 4 protein [Pseudomonadota bacterium]